MRKILKITRVVACWIVCLLFVYVALSHISGMDPWGLTFAFVILPSGIISVVFFVAAIALTKSIFKKRN